MLLLTIYVVLYCFFSQYHVFTRCSMLTVEAMLAIREQGLCLNCCSWIESCPLCIGIVTTPPRKVSVMSQLLCRG